MSRATSARRTARRASARSSARRRLRSALPAHAKVQLGCGERRLNGWVNVDINRTVHPDVRIDLRGGFPAPAGTVARIFSEHLLEHLTLDDGRRLLDDCHAALEPGGIIRIAMPDLRYVVERYLRGGDGAGPGLEVAEDPALRSIDSPALLLNHALRSWGHLYLYDLDELRLRLRQAGFSEVEPREAGLSPDPDLVGLEQRLESRLVVEATK